MGFLNISEMIHILRKYFFQIVALSLAVGLLAGLVVKMSQTYTCTLGFKYNYKDAEEGLAPDGKSKLDPYEIQNPVVIQAALENMGLTNVDVKGIRQDISIRPVVTNLDKEVSESAALLGEKYDLGATEYEMKFTYSASKGDSFGTKMFSSIIKEYDEFLLAKYYNKRAIDDFAKVLNDTNADYMVIAETMSSSLDDTINYLADMSESYPDFRSTTTGYTFAELQLLYQNLRDIQYAKYYGNVRAGNLSKDREMVIKTYQAKVKELQKELDVNEHIAENYKSEIVTFYDSYKESGLYNQAKEVLGSVDSSNNRIEDVLEYDELEEYQNTYDSIILNYTDHACSKSNAKHTIDYYNTIITAYEQDTVSNEIKNKLLEKNDVVAKDIAILSTQYSDIANKTLDELYTAIVSDDLQYLILPEVTADKPVKLVTIFLTIVTFGFSVITVLILNVLKKFVDRDAIKNKDKYGIEEKIHIDTEGMDELHQLLYQQYLDGFNEFYLVYQQMVTDRTDEPVHKEVFIRWKNSKIGMVSPGKIIECVSDFGIFQQLNDWIIKTVCNDLAELRNKQEKMPVIHVNCPYAQINDFGLNDIIIKHTAKNKIPAENICLELSGKDIAESLEDIMLLEEMGIQICIDKFENSDEEQEIIDIVKPKYVKMSLDTLNTDICTTSDKDAKNSFDKMTEYFTFIVEKCQKNGIKTCICGIEKKNQDKIVSDVGFDFKQGYFYGKPIKLEE